MPEPHFDHDVGDLPVAPRYAEGWEANLFWGRMAYTYGGSIDRPLSVVRMGYANSAPDGAHRWPDFAIIPHWNAHGSAQTGTYHDGGKVRCRAAVQNSTDFRNWCVQLQWKEGLFPYDPSGPALEHWHGSLLYDKRDASGLLYRRNRYYDPPTGRFTQEDPIGLAGGVNVCGYAAGDYRPRTYYRSCPAPEGARTPSRLPSAPAQAAVGNVEIQG